MPKNYHDVNIKISYIEAHYYKKKSEGVSTFLENITCFSYRISVTGVSTIFSDKPQDNTHPLLPKVKHNNF